MNITIINNRLSGSAASSKLAETQCCIALTDPYGAIARLKTAVESYPEELRRKVIADSLWLAEFTLMHAQDFAENGDVFNFTGCVTRVCYFLLHTPPCKATGRKANCFPAK